MKKKISDNVINEVRRSRIDVAKERSKNPKQFHEETLQIMRDLGMKKSKLRAMKIDFSRLRKKPNDEAA